MKSFLKKALGWIKGKEDPSVTPDPKVDDTRHFLRAAARAIVLAATSDGSQSDDELVTARLAAKPIPVLASLKESAFAALVKEATAKHAAEGEAASLQFIASAITEPESKAKVFSIAVAVTLADREMKDSEKAFLEKLRQALQLGEEDANTLIHALEENRSAESSLGD